MNINIKDYKSRWDYMADRSGVSRTADLTALPTEFNIVGTFIGDWSTEVDYLLKKYDGGRGFNFLDKLGTNKNNIRDIPYTHELDQYDMEYSGIGIDYKFAHKIDPLKMRNEKDNIPTLWKMIDWFGFTGLVLPKIHIQYPGQVFPFHFDDLTTHRNNSVELSNMDTNQELYARVEVQLLNWQYGHVWGIGNTYWSSWKAGEIMWHPWHDVPHGTANSGRVARINLQVTGGCSLDTISKLKSNHGNIIL
jgi:hypothetical protein